MKTKEETKRILDAVDVVCMNCVMDTLHTSVCDNCPVNFLCDSLYGEE